MLRVVNINKDNTMIPAISVNFYAGAAACAFGGTLSLTAIKKYSCKVFENVSPLLKKAVPSCALLVTADAISQFAKETSPFWRGVAWTVPMLAVLTAELIGETVAEVRVGKNDPKLLQSKAYKEKLDALDLRHSIAVAAVVFATSSASTGGIPIVGSLLGGAMGYLQAMDAALLAKEVCKNEI